MAFDFHYDQQIRRYLLQFIRIFSLIKVQQAPDENGTIVESTVPVRYGDINRMVANILRNNSENTILPSPMMTVWIQSLVPAPDRRNNPFHTSKISIDTREFENGVYGEGIGDSFTVERYMPSPYDLTLQLDVWTTNTTTKMQILEQILTIFNPSIQIQQHMNMLDWSVMTEIELLDVNWTNRIPDQGTESQRDIATLTFKIPIWINPPAKVTRKKLIEQIVTSIYESNDIDSESMDRYFDLETFKNCYDLMDRIIVTPGNHRVKIGVEEAGYNELVLLTSNGSVDESLSWAKLLEAYGELRTGSYITLKSNDDIETSDGEIIGTISLHPSKINTLIFTVNTDTLPDTIDSGPIDKIINPLRNWPGHNLPTAEIGQRYLLLEDIPDNSGVNPWGSVGARENDIIEFNGTNWFISFDASEEEENKFVKSISSHQHYRFTGSDWVHTYFGEYNPGWFRIHL